MKILNLTTSVKSVLPHKVTYSQFLKIENKSIFARGALFSLPQRSFLDSSYTGIQDFSQHEIQIFYCVWNASQLRVGNHSYKQSPGFEGYDKASWNLALKQVLRAVQSQGHIPTTNIIHRAHTQSEMSCPFLCHLVCTEGQNNFLGSQSQSQTYVVRDLKKAFMCSFQYYF